MAEDSQQRSESMIEALERLSGARPLTERIEPQRGMAAAKALAAEPEGNDGIHSE
jgi:hypothetical protein